MRIKARWRRKKLNPFKLRYDEDDLITKTVSVDDNTPMSKLKEFAKEDTPEGYEFIGLTKIDV